MLRQGAAPLLSLGQSLGGKPQAKPRGQCSQTQGSRHGTMPAPLPRPLLTCPHPGATLISDPDPVWSILRWLWA